MNSKLLKMIHNFPAVANREYFEQKLKECDLDFLFYGTGSARLVYILPTEELALKVSFWKGGCIQTKNETHSVFRKHKEFFNVPIAWNESYSLALYSLATPYNQSAFELACSEVYGIGPQSLCDLCYAVQENKVSEASDILLKSLSPFGRKLFDLLFEIHNNKESDLYISDLPLDYLKPCSYGIMKNGTIKVIDFGVSEEYFNTIKGTYATYK